MENLLSMIGTIVYFGLGWLIYLYYQKHEYLDEYWGQRMWAWFLGFLWLMVGVNGDFNDAFNSMFGYVENNR